MVVRGQRFPRHLYPFTSRTTEVGGLAMHYVDEGAGPPIIMVHGNPTWSFHFRRLIGAVAERNRAIACDHIGMGWSERPNRNRYSHTLSARIADFGAFVNSLAIDEPLTLVVHDWGGAIGLGWAVEHADRVSRLVILNTAAFQAPSGRRVPFVLHIARSRFFGEVAVRGANAFVRGAARFGSTRRLAPEVRAGYLDPYDGWATRLAVYEFVRDIPVDAGHPTPPVIESIAGRLDRLAHLPVLIGWGERDFVFDVRFLDEWVRRFPLATIHRYPGAGHLVLEDAADDLIPRIREFVA